MSIEFTSKSVIAPIIDAIVKEAAVNKQLSQEKIEPQTSLTEYYTAALSLKEQHKGFIQLANPDVTEYPNLMADVSDKILKLVALIQTIYKLKRAPNYLIYGILAVGGVVVFSIGTYISKPWMQTAGKVVLLVTAALYLYSWWSYHRNQQKIPQLYQEAGTLGEKIRYDLHYYSATMQLTRVSDGAYSPLFKEFSDGSYVPLPPIEKELKEEK